MSKKLNKTESELLANAKLTSLSQLTANIAHEIRNPLSAISHACQLLEEDQAIQKSSKRMLEIISQNVHRINQIIDEILQAHHHDTSKIVSIQLNPFLKEFHEYFCEVEEIPTQCFMLQLPKEPLTSAFNPMHLDQILWNLCRNGWRHSQRRTGSLTLSLQTISENKISINIQNDGAPITGHQKNHMFEPFFTTEEKGTGLGLYISKQLCIKNQADLSFESCLQYTVFSIHLKKVTMT